MAMRVLRAIEEEGIRRRTARLRVHVPVDVAFYLLNQKRDTIVATTEDITSGANKFIEKLPTSTKAANKAPAMGAL